MNAFLGDLVDIRGGGTPNKSNPEFWGGNIPWASVKDFKSTELEFTADYITKSGVEKSATNIIPAGNIIVPTRMALGKVAINKVDMAINQDLKALIIKDERILFKQYLLRFLESKAKFIEERGKGATVKGITLDILKAIEIPLPPLSEQKRIAAILDKADAIRRKRQQAIQLADEFLRAVFLDMFGDPVTNPKGWEVRSIDELCTDIVDCVNRTAPTVDYKTPYKMIRTTNVRNCSLDIVNVRYVDEETYRKWIRRLRPQIGDIIFTREAPAGEAAVVYTQDKIFLGQRTMHFRPNQKLVSGEYLMFELMGSGVKRQINRMHSGSTVTHLSVPECKKFQIRVPPLKMQRKFELVRSQILRLLKFEKEASDLPLFDSISKKAFLGVI